MLDLIRAFRRDLAERSAERVVRLPHGVGVFADSTPLVYDANRVLVEADAPAAELAAEVDAAMETFHHRRAETEHELDLGWDRTTHLVMARRRPPDRIVDTSMVREVSFDELVAARRHGRESDELADQLDETARRVAAAVPTTWFAAFGDGEVAAYCELRSDGRVAQIEDVGTLPAFRGRGLGRAVVQRAAEAARDAEVLFLEALADDWPRELYAKLGFDAVGAGHLHTRPVDPLTALRLRTPRLELRLGTRAELRALAEVARGGVHPPDEMPFQVPWTDGVDDPDFVERFLAFHESHVAAWSPEAWHWEAVVFHEGRPIGVQALRAADFAGTRTVDSGSWLGLPWQGRGLGTEMRTAALALAFDGLGARLARSGALLGNEKSLAVSRKLGYREVGVSEVRPRGKPVPHHDLEILPGEVRPVCEVRIEGLEQVRERFGA
ncbi:MAG TPA: GNAT family N-acetyltransferase [Gaiellaceae bacterium]